MATQCELNNAQARLYHCMFIVTANRCDNLKADVEGLEKKWNGFISVYFGEHGDLITELRRMHQTFLAVMCAYNWDIAMAMFMDPEVTIDVEDDACIKRFVSKYKRPFGTAQVSAATWGDEWAEYHLTKTGKGFVECDIFDWKDGTFTVKCKGPEERINVTQDDLCAVATINHDHPRFWSTRSSLQVLMKAVVDLRLEYVPMTL